jgi:thymidine phosphorylase
VPSIPLIVSSILSKKLAENLKALVLDVKFGVAAFMPTRAEARALARAMVSLGNECGVKTLAMLTDMNAPVGRTAGNWLEVKESVECLDGNGPEDLRELVVSCAAHLLVQTRRAKTLEGARRQAESRLDSGVSRKKWDEMLAAQGADLAAFNRKLACNHIAPVVIEVKSSRYGFVSRCDARIVGEIVRDLGGGRLTKESEINYDIGIDQLVKPGEAVERGKALARIHAVDRDRADAAAARLKTAIQVSGRKMKKTRLIAETIAKKYR